MINFDLRSYFRVLFVSFTLSLILPFALPYIISKGAYRLMEHIFIWNEKNDKQDNSRQLSDSLN